MRLRQKLLVLYAGNSTPESPVVAWSFYDGTGKTAFEASGDNKPPYPSVLEAMKDGWRVIQYPPMRDPVPGQEYQMGVLKFEFVLEKMEDLDA